MALDLMVARKARPGHEAEARELWDLMSDGKKLSDSDQKRYGEITIDPLVTLDAPRVGFDAAADAYVIENLRRPTAERVAATLAKHHGEYIPALVKCDGIPAFRCGEYAPEFAFGGEFLRSCDDVLDSRLLERIWDTHEADEARDFGRELLAAVEERREKGPLPIEPPPRRGWLSSLLRRAPETRSERWAFEKQLEIVEDAGYWHLYWGERGHRIWPWV